MKPADNNVRKWVPLGIVIILSLAIVFGWPRVLSVGYHLLNGYKISAQGVHAPVPKDFFASRGKDPKEHLIISLLSSTAGIPFHRPAAATINFYELPREHPFDLGRDKRLLDATISAAEDEGFSLEAERHLAVANRTGFCLQFRSSKEEEILQRCFIEGTSVTVYFRGSPRYLRDFDSVLSGISLDATP